jgi:hypothetical protein
MLFFTYHVNEQILRLEVSVQHPMLVAIRDPWWCGIESEERKMIRGIESDKGKSRMSMV